MARQHKFSDPKDKQIHDAHRRFLMVMEEQRLVTMNEQTKSSYLAILTSVTDKLEAPGKPLSEVVRDVMVEAAPFLFQTMQS